MLLPVASYPGRHTGGSFSGPVAAVELSDRAAVTAELTAVRNGAPVRLKLEPFAGIHDERYTVYWPTGASADARTAGACRH